MILETKVRQVEATIPYLNNSAVKRSCRILTSNICDNDDDINGQKTKYGRRAISKALASYLFTI